MSLFTRSDIMAAWRGVRARGWAGVLTVTLLAIALASNVVMFAVADSLVFSPAPFAGADRIVVVSGAVQPPERIEPRTSEHLLDLWRQQKDLVTAAGCYVRKTLFIEGEGANESVSTADVTVDFFSVLGVAPRWGRDFVAGDDQNASAYAVVIGEALARRRFGSPALALGQTLRATSGKLAVVGVMDSSFAFPNTRFQIWRAVDLTGPLTANAPNQPLLLRLTPGIPPSAAPSRLSERSLVVGQLAGLASYTVHTRPQFPSGSSDRRTLVLALAGAAICLLLATCANVASMELAIAVRRARINAVQLALGAGRWRIARTSLLEGLMLISAAFVLAAAAARLLIGLVQPYLPTSLGLATNNPIDFDGRALLAMLGFAAIAWLVAATPSVVAASRASFVSLLKTDDRTAGSSRGAFRLRRVLTSLEVAVAIATVVVGLLYVRSYQNLLAVDKGFDSRRLYDVSWTMQADYSNPDFSRRATELLRATPGVEAVTASSPPPNTGDSPSSIALEVDGRAPLQPPVLLARKWVDIGYFDVVNLPLKHGRLPRATDAPTDVVVPESFALKFFGSADAVGHTFRNRPNEPWSTIIGVVGDFRSNRTRMPSPDDREVRYYAVIKPAPPAPAAAPAVPRPTRIDDGGTTRFASRIVRTNGLVSEAQLLTAARSVDPRLPVTVDSVDQMYADQNADVRMASEIVGVFGVISFGIAMAGVYMLMAFLVASRSREIGIRMALGADARAIRGLVLGSCIRMVIAGVTIGVTVAWLASRWVESQLFGVSPSSLGPYAWAAVWVVLISLAATWQPARQAARVDPAITLRAE
jgi:predicted permease